MVPFLVRWVSASAVRTIAQSKVHCPRLTSRMNPVPINISLLALALVAVPSVSHALVTVDSVTPSNIDGYRDRLAVAVVRHEDNTITFSVSVACKENRHVVLRSHVADSETTFSRHSCMVYPINGTATVRVRISEKLLETSRLSCSLASSRPVGGGNRLLNSGTNIYSISLTDFAAEATVSTLAANADDVHGDSVPAPPPITVTRIGPDGA